MPDYGLDLAPVDFAAIARACGLNGVTVDNPEALEKELQLATVSSTTTLIDARVDSKLYQDSFGRHRLNTLADFVSLEEATCYSPARQSGVRIQLNA